MADRSTEAMTLMFSKYKRNNIFVETGTQHGYTVEIALGLGYEKVITVEFNKSFYDNCCSKFDNDNRVVLFLGDSKEKLSEMIEPYDVPLDFWLDAHSASGDPNVEHPAVPLMDELNVIFARPRKAHTILIDDIDLLGDSSSGMALDFGDEETTKQKLINYIKEYDNACEFDYDEDKKILICNLSGKAN